MCHFLGQLLGCAYTICLYGRIEISCTFPSGSPCRPNRVLPYTPSVLICCIRLYVIDRFVSVIAYPTFTVLLRLVYSRFDIIGPYGVVLCCY